MLLPGVDRRPWKQDHAWIPDRGDRINERCCAGLVGCCARKPGPSLLVQENNDYKWTVFDGPVDASCLSDFFLVVCSPKFSEFPKAIWIENMNTVLDDNMTLCALLRLRHLSHRVWLWNCAILVVSSRITSMNRRMQSGRLAR